MASSGLKMHHKSYYYIHKKLHNSFHLAITVGLVKVKNVIDTI